MRPSVPLYAEATNYDADEEVIATGEGVVHYASDNVRNWADMQRIDPAIIAQLEPLDALLPIGILKNLFVDEEFRSQGYGSDLIAELMDEAWRAGAKTLLLEADIGDTSNVIALEPWFQSFGFETIGYSNGYPIMILHQSN